jgi:hypothetical protein
MRILPAWRPAMICRLAPPILTVLAAACSSALDTTQDYADNATIEVTGTSPVPLLVISSTDWLYVRDANGNLVAAVNRADTTRHTALPIMRSVPIQTARKIHFKLVNPDSTQTANIRMVVRLDNNTAYDQAATMRNASLEFSFSYGTIVGLQGSVSARQPGVRIR